LIKQPPNAVTLDELMEPFVGHISPCAFRLVHHQRNYRDGQGGDDKQQTGKKQ
jgi:hypothetical protein